MTTRVHESGQNENAEAQPTIDPRSLSPSPFGCDVPPMGPLQDMFGSLDVVAGQFPPDERTANQATFTGGTAGNPQYGNAYGGQAEPPSGDKIGVTVPSNPASNADGRQ